MLKNEENRVRATFTLDSQLFELLKLSSQIEKKPMSRIVEEEVKKHVSKYEHILEVIMNSKEKGIDQLK